MKQFSTTFLSAIRLTRKSTKIIPLGIPGTYKFHELNHFLRLRVHSNVFRYSQNLH